MRKILYSAVVLCASLFAACSDQNDVVNDLIDQTEERSIIKSFPYTLTEADYTTISKAAVTEADEDAANKALAEAVATEQSLNSFANASDFFPDFLAKKFVSLDVTSAVQVTYAYREDYLNNLSTEPTMETVYSENFESYAANDVIGNGWANIAVAGTKVWSARYFASETNTYMQFSSNDNPAEVNDVYAVSPAYDLTNVADPALSFRTCAAFWNYANLSVLISTDAAARTNPAAAKWDDVSGQFAIPTTPTSGYGKMSPAGRISLANYKGKTIYVAFRYQGQKSPAAEPNRSSTFQIDDVTITNGPLPVVGGVYINNGGIWSLYPNGIAVTADDLKAMGVDALDTKTAPKYIPAFLAQKFPYAQEKDRKAVIWNGVRADEYVYLDGKWEPSTVGGGRRTEQYVLSDNGWVFDPTIVYNLDTEADYMLVVNHVLNDPELAKYSESSNYTNEEWYYGFNAHYKNVSLRIANREGMASSVENDKELHSLPDVKAKNALLWTRLEQKGMPLFLKLRFPNTPLEVDGVNQMYNIIVLIYGYDGVSADSAGKLYSMIYRVTKAGPNPEFQFVEKKEL